MCCRGAILPVGNPSHRYYDLYVTQSNARSWLHHARLTWA